MTSTIKVRRRWVGQPLWGSWRILLVRDNLIRPLLAAREGKGGLPGLKVINQQTVEYWQEQAQHGSSGAPNEGYPNKWQDSVGSEPGVGLAKTGWRNRREDSDSIRHPSF